MTVMNHWRTDDGDFALFDLSRADQKALGTKSFMDGVLLVQMRRSDNVAAALSSTLQRQQTEIEIWLHGEVAQ